MKMRVPMGSVKPLTPRAKLPMIDRTAGGYAERGRLYGSSRWREERKEFLRAFPFCEACATKGVRHRATVVDHVAGHDNEGWRDRFWDRSNWQSLCASCHSTKTAGEVHDRVLGRVTDRVNGGRDV